MASQDPDHAKIPLFDIPAALRSESDREELARALVVEIADNGEIDVVVPPDADTRIRCDYLETGSPGIVIEPGDLVLVMLPSGIGQNGCVLGRVGRYRPPDHVVVEAGESLTLKCGEGSVALRKDGKVLIRGNDVVSRARRTHRIKGGTVAIN